MYCIRIHEFGGAGQLVYEEASLPEPKPGQVRVRVQAVGLNFIEVYLRKGVYRSALPFTPGGEFAGIVDAVGDGVADFQPGDRVATEGGSGGYAEYALAPAARLVHVPQDTGLNRAAAVLLQGITAHYLALSTFELNPGDTALVHAAAGGVGHLLVQIAKKCGARVIATVSTSQKAQLARESGADEVILYSQEDFEPKVKDLTGGRGVDVVYDGVGKATFERSLNCLRPRGMMVLYGQASGLVDPINPQVLNQKGSLFLTRPSIGHYLQTRDELLWRTNDLFQWMASGKLKVRIDRTFLLKEAPAAHDYIEARETKGKVLLLPEGA